MSQDPLDLIQIHPGLNHSGCAGMPQIMEMEILNLVLFRALARARRIFAPSRAVPAWLVKTVIRALNRLERESRKMTDGSRKSQGQG